MNLLTVVFIVLTILFIAEFLSGKIFVYNQSVFPDRKIQPGKYWKELGLHLVVIVIVASSLLGLN